MNRYTLTKIKTFRGREGQGFNATLCCDGVPVAHIDDAANGGCYRWYWLAKDRAQMDADEAAFKAHVAANSTETFEPEDAFVSAMVEDAQITRQVKGWLRKSVTFTSGRVIRRTKAPPSDALIANIIKQYPGAQILNTMPLAEAVALVKQVSA